MCSNLVQSDLLKLSAKLHFICIVCMKMMITLFSYSDLLELGLGIWQNYFNVTRNLMLLPETIIPTFTYYGLSFIGTRYSYGCLHLMTSTRLVTKCRHPVLTKKFPSVDSTSNRRISTLFIGCRKSVKNRRPIDVGISNVLTGLGQLVRRCLIRCERLQVRSPLV